MSDLSPHARGLLDDARGAYEPRSADQARVRAALVLGAPSIAGAAASTVAKVQATGVLKLTAFVASVVVGSVGVVEGTAMLRAPTPQPPAHVAVVRHAAVVARPRPVEAPPPVVEADVMDIEPAPPAPSPVARSAPPTLAHAMPAPVFAPAVAPAPAASTPPAAPLGLNRVEKCDAAAELAVVQRLQRWLSSAPLEALRQLDDFEDLCPEGTLIEERLATRAIALCSAARQSEGRAQLALLQARNASSPALTRVRQACAAP